MSGSKKIVSMLFSLFLCSTYVYGESFNESMRLLEKSFFSLFAHIQNRATFSSEYHEEEILKNIKSFQGSAKHLGAKKVKMKLGDDPITQFYVAGLKDDLKRAEQAFLSGHKEYARTVLKSSVSYCFRCHTRSNQGPKFNFSLYEKNQKDLSAVAKADLLLASRQYDRAEKELWDYLNKALASDGKLDPFTFERSIEKFVTLAVRSDGDNSKVIKLAKLVKKSKKPNRYIKEKVAVWEKEIKKVKYVGPDEVTVSQLLGLFERAHNIALANGESHAQMHFLALSSVASKKLAHKITRSQKAQIYYWLGVAYATISDFGYWEAPEVYYQSCVKILPKSSIAKRCYKAYEDSITLGYTGSRGVSIPISEKEKLKDLKKKAY